MKLGRLLLLLFLIGPFVLEAEATISKNIKNLDREFWATIGHDAALQIGKTFGFLHDPSEKQEFSNGITVMKVRESELHQIGHLMHDKFHRCGGFIGHETLAEALEWANNEGERFHAKSMNFADYSINQGESVRALLTELSAPNIASTIQKLSSFKNRYYKSQTGQDSQKLVKETWETLVQGRTDAKVEFFRHSGWPQPSVVLTLTGSETPEEIIVLGGHGDSISGYFGDRSSNHAPGADDNASGIATLTEIVRVLMTSSYRPKHTIKFMAYAAEEVGLWGSKEIAQQAKRENQNIIGVMQLDMTNYKGSADLDIVLMSDYTNTEQNAFMGRLIDEYVKVPWGQDRCGYACSDHASWHGQGFPASMPFEARMNEMNRRIHTPQDTIELSRGNAQHALHFAKLGVAFAVELDN
ncbi:MAG: M20/M25/M40 family metallo-hydrolase [Bdellovibrio sp.]|nr:M20/M25/M40 family metallo-hydrolase [Bdellovibrio sp.]